MKKDFKKQETAADKAKRGLLLTNASDVDAVVSRNVNMLHSTPAGAAIDGGIEMRAEKEEKPKSGLTANFGDKKPAKEECGFGYWAMAIMANTVLTNLSAEKPPTYEHV